MEARKRKEAHITSSPADGDGEHEGPYAPTRAPPIRQRQAPRANLIESCKRGSRLLKWVQLVQRGLAQSNDLSEVETDAAPRMSEDSLPVLAEILNEFGRELITRSIAMAEADPRKTRRKLTKPQIAALLLPNSDETSFADVERIEKVSIFSESHVRAALQSFGMLHFVQAGDTVLNRLAGQAPDSLYSLDLNVLPLGPVKLNPEFLQARQTGVFKPAAKRKRL